LATRITFNSF